MFPIALDLTRIPILLTGKGPLLHKRYRQLVESGATQVTLMEDAVPASGDLAGAAVVMVAGFAHDESSRIAQQARALGKLVNVEDVNELCDFHFTANIRRGDLLISVSTGGGSPTLGGAIRDAIAALFGEEWAGRLREMAHQRQAWKAQGASMRDIKASTERYIREQAWLPDSSSVKP